MSWMTKKIRFFIPLCLLLCLSVSAAYAREAETGTWTDLQEAINEAGDGDTITLTGNVTAGVSDTAIEVSAGKSVVLDLAGFTLNRNLAYSDSVQSTVIQVPSDSVLTIRDSGEGTGTITGGNAPHGGGIRNSGTLILEGGCVAGNKATTAGGGIVNYGVLVMTGGQVTGNTADVRGGGIYNAVKGYMTIGADTAAGNTAPTDADICNLGSIKTIGGQTIEFAAITDYLNILSVLPALMIVLLLILAVRIDNYLDKDQKKVMYVISVLVFTLILQNYLENWMYLTGGEKMLRTVTSIYGYVVRPAILAIFLQLLQPGRCYTAVWALVSANAVIYMTALFSPLAFSYPYGHFVGGPLCETCMIVSALLLFYLFYLTIRVFHPRRYRETWIPIIVIMIICAGVALDYSVEYNEQPVTFLTIAITISCVFYYVWLHLQFVREHEEDLRASQRIQIMMSQIKPHFLFNTLSTIQALCAKDLPGAIYAIERFGVYLRRNIEVLDQANLIPLVKELEHTRAYTDIEVLRFSDIHVDYDIQEMDMSVPALSVQPLVENAIRHGIRGKKDGCVTVVTRRLGNENQIIIRDNGKGFDPAAAEENAGTHIGIKNVRSRLDQMCGGRMEIDSRIGEGTTITIMLPVTRK